MEVSELRKVPQPEESIELQLGDTEVISYNTTRKEVNHGEYKRTISSNQIHACIKCIDFSTH